jgi:hypothetical protein
LVDLDEQRGVSSSLLGEDYDELPQLNSGEVASSLYPLADSTEPGQPAAWQLNEERKGLV